MSFDGIALMFAEIGLFVMAASRVNIKSDRDRDFGDGFGCAGLGLLMWAAILFVSAHLTWT